MASSHSIRPHMILIILVFIFIASSTPVLAQDPPAFPVATDLPPITNDTRVRAAAVDSNTAHADLLRLKASVQWLDANIGQFGSTFNFTFVLPDVFTSHWQIRFRMATNGTIIKEYWDLWQVVKLPNNWYQLVPSADMRLDNTSSTYLSFNGYWDGAVQEVTLETLGINAAEIQIAPREGNDEPTVYTLDPGTEFINTQLLNSLPNAPFGDFIRSQKESLSPQQQSNRYQPPAPGPTANWTGMYICQPILWGAALLFAAASFSHYRCRLHFRQQCLERDRAKKSSASQPSSTMVAAPPAYMEGGEFKAEGGAVGEVYTYYTREQNRQSILQPGLALRMSVYQGGNQAQPLPFKPQPQAAPPEHAAWRASPTPRNPSAAPAVLAAPAAPPQAMWQPPLTPRTPMQSSPPRSPMEPLTPRSPMPLTPRSPMHHSPPRSPMERVPSPTSRSGTPRMPSPAVPLAQSPAPPPPSSNPYRHMGGR